MNFLITGPGAMGCLIGAGLKRAGHDVALLDYRQERADHINENGIRVEGITGEYTVRVPALTGTSSVAPDVVLICVKANQTREAAEGLSQWLEPGAMILTLQNGLGNVEILEEIFGKDRVLGGVTAEGGTLLGPGHVRHAGQGDTVLGPEARGKDPLKKILSAFNEAGFKTRSAQNVKDLIWGKLVVNVGINALTAITGLKNGRIGEIEGTRAVMEEAVKEAVAVAHAVGINLPYQDPVGRVLEVCRMTGENVASMLQDILRERITEISFINGAIVLEGGRLGIAAPVNRTLTCLVRAIQETYDERVTGC
jgi:2-dehydropantoate 2-reductase